MMKAAIETKYDKGDKIWAVVFVMRTLCGWPWSQPVVRGPLFVESVQVIIRDGKQTETSYYLDDLWLQPEANCFATRREARAERDRRNKEK